MFERLPHPRAWQEEAVRAWVDNGHRGIAEVVTGAGKTIFAMLCIDAAFRSSVAQSVVVLVPTLALLDQWYVALREELGLREEQIGLWSGAHTPSETALVNVMVLNTARRAVHELADPTTIMLVADECHRMSSPVNSTALARAYSATLGMSATPDSEFDDRLAEVLQPHLGPIVFRYSINRAYEEGILAKFDLTNVRLELLPAERDAYDKLTVRIRAYMRRNPDAGYQDDRLKILLRRRAVVATRAKMRVPVTVNLADSVRGARTIVFHEFQQNAEAIARQLRERGHSATIYHSGIAPSMRRDNLRLFRKGQFDVLVTCRALDEGINVPEVQIAIIAGATSSNRQRVQRLGRVLRPAPNKDRASIFTLYATEPEERRLKAESERLTAARSVTWQRVNVRRG